MFLKLPLNHKNPEARDLTVDFLMRLDNKISSMNFKDLVSVVRVKSYGSINRLSVAP